MKKTIITILALAGVSLGAEVSYTLTTSLPAENYNASSAYGFYLNLSSNIKEKDGASYTLTPTITLNSFTLEWAHGSYANLNNEFALVVVDSSNAVLGFSSYEKVKNDGTGSFSFTAADGEAPLTLSSTTTYRYLTVNSTVIDYIKNSTTSSCTYSAGSGEATMSEGNISGGLVSISNRAYATSVSSTTLYSNALFITNADGVSSEPTNGYNLHVRPENISVTVPEPTTATLSLLALAGLAARRRRK